MNYKGSDKGGSKDNGDNKNQGNNHDKHVSVDTKPSTADIKPPATEDNSKPDGTQGSTNPENPNLGTQ